jgi:hypothetical protein
MELSYFTPASFSPQGKDLTSSDDRQRFLLWNPHLDGLAKSKNSPPPAGGDEGEGDL